MGQGGRAPSRPLTPPPPPFPWPAAHVWDWFCEIRGGVQGNGWVPARLTWRDVESWSSLTGLRPQPWEARLLIDLGALRAETLAAEAESGADRGGKDQG